MKDDPAIPTTAPALHLFPAALQPTAPASVALALRELPPPPLLPLSLNPAPASRASANASSPPTPIQQCNPLRNHILWNSQQKSSANPIQPPSAELKE